MAKTGIVAREMGALYYFLRLDREIYSICRLHRFFQGIDSKIIGYLSEQP